MPSSSEDLDSGTGETVEVATKAESVATAAPSVGSFLNEFCTSSTVPGLSRVGAHKKIACRIFWLVFLLAVYGGLVFHLYVMIRRYSEKPLLSGMSTSQSFEFPDVYFCPSEVLSMSKIVESYNSSEVQRLGGLKTVCNLDCQISLSKFDINTLTTKPVLMSRAMESLSDTLAATERSLIDTYRLSYMQSKNLTECRYTITGEEYAGNANTVPVIGATKFGGINATAFNRMPLVTIKPCMSWNDAAQRLRSSGVAAAAAGEAILALGFSDRENRCRHPRGLPLSRLQTVALGSKSLALRIPPPNMLTEDSAGPYCFYLDDDGWLSAHYCDIPFCPAPPKYDCAVDNADRTVYTGYANVTRNGRQCLAWRKVKEGVEAGTLRLPLDDFIFIFFAIDLITLHIRTPDYGISNSSNYCRAANIMYDAWEIHSGYIRDVRYQFLKPSCFYLSPDDESLVLNDICEVKSCYESSPSVSGSIRDRVGRALLTRQFSAGLTVGFTDCKFYNQPCTRDDFVNIEHPELGVCHRFVKDKFLKGLRKSQVAEAKLQFKYFTDSSDSLGRKFENMSKMASAVHMTFSDATDAETAMTVIAVPTGDYPWAARGVPAFPAKNTRLMLSYDMRTRLSRAAQPCGSRPEPVKYRVNTWRAGPPKDHLLNSTVFDDVKKASTWYEKIDKLRHLLTDLSALKGSNFLSIEYTSATRDDCINAYVVKKFITNCDCLPSFLPIPTELTQSMRLCFNQTDAVSLYRTEQCHQQQVDNIEVYRTAAHAECRPQCETRSYSIREMSHPWPSVKRERALSFLTELAGMQGYPNDVRSSRGAGSLYYAYFRALQLSEVPLGSRNLSDLVGFAYELDIVQDRLAMVTVQAAQAFGEAVVEEEAYPMNNLFADIGGALGLWCGLSVLTLCELLELCSILLLRLQCRGAVLLRQLLGLEASVESQKHTAV